jgi:hypothetical protein
MRRFHLASLVVLVLAGCAGQPTRPVREPLLLTLTLSASSGDEAHPVTARVSLTNIGDQPIAITVPCTGPGFGPAIRDPDRANILDACTECPGPVPCPLCIGIELVLQPGETADRSVVYSGTLDNCEGPYQGPAGTYTVEAGTPYRRADGRVDSVASSTTFTWSTTAAR